MIRPSIILSLLTTMMAAELSSSKPEIQSQNRSTKTVLVMDDEVSEDEKIAEEAKRCVGRELADL